MKMSAEMGLGKCLIDTIFESDQIDWSEALHDQCIAMAETIILRRA